MVQTPWGKAHATREKFDPQCRMAVQFGVRSLGGGGVSTARISGHCNLLLLLSYANREKFESHCRKTVGSESVPSGAVVFPLPG